MASSIKLFRNKWAGVVLICLFLFHGITYLLPMINLEWVFLSASKFFKEGDTEFLKSYFLLQANTLGTSYLIHLLHSLLPWLHPSLAARMVPFLGLPILAMAIILLARTYRQAGAVIGILMLVFLNPLIWVFSARVTADLLPASLAVLAMAMAIDQVGRPDPLWARRISIFVILGLAGVIKYHALILLPCIALTVLMDDQTSARNRVILVMAGAMIALAPALAYIAWLYERFGFWITSPHFSFRVDIFSYPLAWLNNYVGYTAYLAILCFPFSICLITQSEWVKRYILRLLIFLLTSFFAGFILIDTGQELNFGPADRYVNQSVVAGLFALLSFCFHLSVFLWVRGEEKIPSWISFFSSPLFLLIVIVIFILVLSFARPSQRYLLFILPLYILFLTTTVKRPDGAAFFLAVVSLAANVYVGLNQYATGTAARQISQALVSLEITDPVGGQAITVKDVNPGAVHGHTGDMFPTIPSNFRFTIVEGNHTAAIHQSAVRLLPGVGRTYSLIPLSK